MNTLLNDRFSESLHSLALGVEPIDAAREQPMLSPAMLTHDDAPFGNPRQPFERHDSNRHALRYDAYYAASPRTVRIRRFDQTKRCIPPTPNAACTRRPPTKSCVA